MSKPRFKVPETKANTCKKPRAKGFIQINADQREQIELRKLAHAFGIDLRTFLRHAVLNYKMEHLDLLATAQQNGVSPRTLLSLTCTGAAVAKN